MSDFVLPAYGAELWSDPLNTALQWLHDNAAGIRTDLDSAANVAALAQTAASNAQTTANTANDTANTALDYAQGRVQVSYATVRPTPAADERVLWYDPNNGYQASYWDGISWVARPFGAGSLDNNAVLSRNIVAGAIGADQIAAGAIVAAKIAAGAVTADAIAAGSVTTDKLAAGAVTAASIAAGSITTDLLAAGAVTADTIDVDALNGKTIIGSTIETAKTGERIVIAPTSVEGVNAIELYSGQTGEATPARLAAGVDADSIEFVSLTASKITGGPAPAELLMVHDVTISTDEASSVTLRVLESSGLAKAFLSVKSEGVQIAGGLQITNEFFAPFPATINGLDFGIINGNADSNGNLVTNHKLGTTPIAVFIQMGNHPSIVAKILPSGLNAASFEGHYVNSTTGNAVASGTGIDGWYLALA